MLWIIVSIFLKSVHNSRLPTPNYFSVWDVNTWLSYIKHKDISSFYDIAKLLLILAGTRVNTLVHLKATNMYITDTEATFTFDEVL